MASPKLTNVCQGGSFTNGVCQSGAQSRVFVYDSLARLTSATNPESTAATTYGYDSDSNLVKKTDADNNVITTAYDALNRVISKTYTPTSTPSVTYCYDGNTQSPCASAPSGTSNYLVGRLTLVGSLCGSPCALLDAAGEQEDIRPLFAWG
jgi:YD repeat-containing protein